MKEDEIYLKDIVQVLRKRKWFIVIGTVVIMALAGVISVLMHPTYQSSVMLEIGEIYLPSSPITEPAMLLEEVTTVAELINGDVFSEIALKQSGKNILDPETLSYQMEVEIFEKEKLPLIIVSCNSRDPRQAFELVSNICKSIIARHDKKYDTILLPFELSIRNIEENIFSMQEIIKSIEGEIKAIQSQIKAIMNKIVTQTQYSIEVVKDISKGEDSLEQFKNKLSEIKPTQASPVEILFLQTSYSNEQMHISELRNTQAELQIEIENRNIEIEEKKIKIEGKRQTIEDRKNSMLELKEKNIGLKLKLDLSTQTQIIKSANLPEFPIRPNKKIFLIAGAFIGFIFSTSFTLLREILKS